MYIKCMRSRMAFFKYIVLSLSLSGIFACGSDSDNKDSENLPVIEFKSQKIVDFGNGDYELTENHIRGKGVFGLEDPLGSIQSAKKIYFDFSLEDGGEIRLHTYADQHLNKGVDFLFTRSNEDYELQIITDEKTVTLELGEEHNHAEDEEHTEEEEKVHSLIIDVHNDETPVHVIIWKNEEGHNLDELDIIYNSEDAENSDLETEGNGKGVYAGFTMMDGEVINFSTGDATPESEVGESHGHDHDDE